MHGISGAADVNLGRFGNSAIVGTQKDVENTSAIGTVGSSQHPVGWDEWASAEAAAINGQGNLPAENTNDLKLNTWRKADNTANKCEKKGVLSIILPNRL